MFHLIIKDILIQKKSFLFLLVYPIFIMVAFAEPGFSNFVYIMMGVAITYIFALTAVSYDEKNKSDVLLLSLPIKKKHIVTAKYLSIFVFCLISILFSGIIGGILSLSGFFPQLRFINMIDIVSIFISMGLLMSLYYPFYFKFGAIRIRLLNICFFMMVFFAPSKLLMFLFKNKDNIFIHQAATWVTHMPSWILGLLILIIILIFMLVSLLVSLKIYNNKDF